MFTDLQSLLITLPAILLALTVHEFAHGWAADRLGDPTARLSGRLTLAPLAHIDWFGLLLLVFAGWGWAKPVPINPYNFRRPKQGMLYTALAGPLSNLLFAVVTAIAIGLSVKFGLRGGIVLEMLQALCEINIVLAVFNMIPVPPLDGSRILAGLLPDRGSSLIWRLEQYGPIILIVLVVSGAIDFVLRPGIIAIARGLTFLIGLF